MAALRIAVVGMYNDDGDIESVSLYPVPPGLSDHQAAVFLGQFESSWATIATLQDVPEEYR